MAWIESHQKLRDHPKLTILAEKLGISKPQAVGHLHYLWWWCIDYAVDGQLCRYSPSQIASAAGWEGNSGEFIQQLADSGFIDRDPLRIHDWLDFCGDLIKKRLEYKREKDRRKKRLEKSLRKSENSQLTVTVPYQTVTIPDQTNKEITPSSAPKSAVQELVDLFHMKLTEKLGEKPASFNGGVLGRLFKQALTTQTVDEAKRRIDLWFKSSETFIQTNGYSPTLFAQKYSLLKGGPIHGTRTSSNVRLQPTDPDRAKAYEC